MMPLADAEHFVRAPDWTWYILFYFFLAGLSGGSYVLATLLRLRGGPANESAARVGYYVAFPPMLGCPILLTLDLGKPLRFWHMLVNTTPGDMAPIFKYWSPMSVGAWALVVFSVFVTVSFVGALAGDRVIHLPAVDRLLGGAFGKLWSVLGAVAGLFIASGLSGSAALLGWLVRHRRDAQGRAVALVRGERFFLLLELALIVAVVVTLIPAGALSKAFGFPWILLWLVAVASLLPGLRGPARTQLRATPDGAAAVPVAAAPGLMLTTLVLIGVLALRAAVIFSAQ